MQRVQPVQRESRYSRLGHAGGHWLSRKLIVLFALVLCGTGLSVMGAPASSAASCAYHDYGSSYTLSFDTDGQGRTWEDAGMWIVLRRSTACTFYVVIVNKKATGRSSCEWNVGGGIAAYSGAERTTCPAQGQTYTSTPHTSSTGTGYATLNLLHNYPNACGNLVRGFYGSSGDSITPIGLRTPRCGG